MKPLSTVQTGGRFLCLVSWDVFTLIQTRMRSMLLLNVISLYTNTDLSTERILDIQIIFSRHPTDTLSSLSSLSSSSFNESDTDISNIDHVTMQCSSTRNDRRPHSDNVPCHTINTLRDVTRLDLASKFLHARIRTCKKKFDQSMPNPQHTGLKGSTSRQLNLSPHHDGLQHDLTLISDWRL